MNPDTPRTLRADRLRGNYSSRDIPERWPMPLLLVPFALRRHSART
jgi:hypothetical protein